MRIIKTLTVLSISLLVLSCGDDTKENNKTTTTTTVSKPVETIQKDSKVVCMWKAVSLKEKPSQKGKYITTMYLGETATTHNEVVIDTTSKKKREYIKVTLADNTTGWIQQNLVAVNASPYVLIAPTKLYKRPDLIASSDKTLPEMQYVAVLETKGDWAKVKGKKYTNKWFSEGWVKLSKLSNDETDILAAILYEKTNYITDKNKRIKALQEIVNDADLSKSRWIDEINTEIVAIKTALIDNETEDDMEMPAPKSPANVAIDDV